VRYRDHAHHRKADTVPLLASSSGGFIALWAVIYFVLLVTLGIISIRKGHWVMFIIGIFVPLFWFIGALLPRRVR
jgi:ABC-type multidrug transport system permease subunit